MDDSSDIQAAGQHYLVCGTEDCKKNGQFYCNDCHRPMCEQCRDEHLNSPDTKLHETVLYRHRKHELPEEKCKLHPKRNVDIFCKECQIPLCSKCSTMKEHNSHSFEDLEEIYSEKYASWQAEFSKIQKYFLPTSQDLKTDIEKDAIETKNIMENIRKAMKSEAESLKLLVDEVTSEKIRHTYTMEDSLLKMLKSQETMYDNYIAYLEKMTDEFQEFLSLTNKKLLFTETLKIQTIPETTKPVLPVFTAGQLNRDDVAKLIGRVIIPNAEPEKRRIKPMESISTHMKLTEKEMEQSLEKSGAKLTLSLTSSVTKVREYSVPGVECVSHVSEDKSGRLWVSDRRGNLVQTDLQENLLQSIQTMYDGCYGNHTVTQDGDLLYVDKGKKVVYRITPQKQITEFIKMRDGLPLCVHSSRINGDMLVGVLGEQAKVTRYNKIGKEIQNIQKDIKGQELYRGPWYMTENINGDICTSDGNKQAVVVVNKLGQHKFSYTGQGSRFLPWGICTDDLGHILVCDGAINAVHLLNQSGGFLSIIVSKQQGVESTYGLCVDGENNLHVGHGNTNTVKIYKYLQ